MKPHTELLETLETLAKENSRLKTALTELIPWAGNSADGPAWASPEIKRKNMDMCEEAIYNASECFPRNYDGFQDFHPVSSN